MRYRISLNLGNVQEETKSTLRQTIGIVNT